MPNQAEIIKQLVTDLTLCEVLETVKEAKTLEEVAKYIEDRLKN
jgi:hypothetical protein